MHTSVAAWRNSSTNEQDGVVSLDHDETGSKEMVLNAEENLYTKSRLSFQMDNFTIGLTILIILSNVKCYSVTSSCYRHD